MEITLKKVTVAELTTGYVDNEEEGVRGYGGKLDIRPPYQREFVYKEAQRDAVIHTVMKNFPLNVMYWAVRNDGTYEVIDGQQRTLSLCQFVNGDFSYEMRYIQNMTDDERQKILDYELMIYECKGTESEKLEWFKTINIAGEKLTDQELRNAVYAGPWLLDAKSRFSKNGCAAYKLANKYINGSAIRQDYLETAIKWMTKGECSIEEYMAKHQYDNNAVAMWNYFLGIINWVQAVFPKYRKEMKGVDWGALYAKFGNENLDHKTLEARVQNLMADSDVTAKKGIYSYVLDGKEKSLSIRSFDDNTRRSVYEKQGGKCAHCHKSFDIEEMHADHKKPWSKGGRTIEENCEMLCRDCNLAKGAK